MIEISNEEITNKMFFIREENSNQPIAVIKVGDLMNFKRPQGEWIPNYTSQFMNPGRSCSLCGKIVEFSENYCPKCGAYMRGEQNA